MSLLSSIGKMNNAYQGITSSAKQAQGYAVTNALMNHQMQKEFAQNAHQWEMEDLKKAGLNPALTATGGSGASASGGGSFGGSSGTSAGNPIETANLLIGMRNQTSATRSQNNLNDANAVLALANAKNIPQKLKVEMMNALSNQITAKANATSARETAKNERMKHPFMRKIYQYADEAEERSKKYNFKEAKNAKEAWQNIMLSN